MQRPIMDPTFVLETPAAQARDDDSARALWSASVELTGIDPSFSL